MIVIFAFEARRSRAAFVEPDDLARPRIFEHPVTQCRGAWMAGLMPALRQEIIGFGRKGQAALLAHSTLLSVIVAAC
jgi:hypothetical protein